MKLAPTNTYTPDNLQARLNQSGNCKKYNKISLYLTNSITPFLYVSSIGHPTQGELFFESF